MHESEKKLRDSIESLLWAVAIISFVVGILAIYKAGESAGHSARIKNDAPLVTNYSAEPSLEPGEATICIIKNGGKTTYITGDADSETSVTFKGDFGMGENTTINFPPAEIKNN